MSFAPRVSTYDISPRFQRSVITADRLTSERHAAEQPLRALEPAALSFATLLEDERLDGVAQAVLALLRDIGSPLDGKSMQIGRAHV